jgi:hypothetical protein
MTGLAIAIYGAGMLIRAVDGNCGVLEHIRPIKVAGNVKISTWSVISDDISLIRNLLLTYL